MLTLAQMALKVEIDKLGLDSEMHARVMEGVMLLSEEEVLNVASELNSALRQLEEAVALLIPISQTANESER